MGDDANKRGFDQWMKGQGPDLPRGKGFFDQPVPGKPAPKKGTPTPQAQGSAAGSRSDPDTEFMMGL